VTAEQMANGGWIGIPIR